MDYQQKGLIMTKLYPIGTQLITRRISQASFADELDFCVETQVSTGKFYPNFDIGFDNFDGLYHTWRVTVTKKNQKWLSPVPIVGDLVDVYKEYSVFTPMYFSKFEFELSENFSAVVKRIIERTYPNGQRAPLIEWDEVILPETKGE
jgi:hypothetical protein